MYIIQVYDLSSLENDAQLTRPIWIFLYSCKPCGLKTLMLRQFIRRFLNFTSHQKLSYTKIPQVTDRAILIRVNIIRVMPHKTTFRNFRKDIWEDRSLSQYVSH